MVYVTPGKLDDTYLAVWYQDVWNHTFKDTLQPRLYESDSIINYDCYNQRAQFMPSAYSACVGEEVVFTNMSVGDSTCNNCIHWIFGSDADLQLLGDTIGAPKVVTYYKPGKKDVTMKVMTQCGFTDEFTWENCIEIIPDTVPVRSIMGPDTVCEGGEVYFQTEFYGGISYYHWEVPPGATIIDGDGQYMIKVIMGDQSGQVKVTPETTCGMMSPITKNVGIRPSDDNGVLLVVGEESLLSVSDEVLKTKVEQHGYNVWLRDDDEIQLSDHSCVNIVIISGTTDKNKVKAKLFDVNTPVIVMNSEVYSDMQFATGYYGVDYGTKSNVSVNVIDDTHDLGETGLPAGTYNVYENIDADSVVYAVNAGGPAMTVNGIDFETYPSYLESENTDIHTTTNSITNNEGFEAIFQSVIEDNNTTHPSQKWKFPIADNTVDYKVTLLITFYDDVDRPGTAVYINSKFKGKYDFTSSPNYEGHIIEIPNVRIISNEMIILLDGDKWKEDWLAGIIIEKQESPTLNWAELPHNAIKIAEDPANSSNYMLFGYEIGTSLHSSPTDSSMAKARRVGFFMDKVGAQYLTEYGDSLLSNALC
jgi:hypothetical protein